MVPLRTVVRAAIRLIAVREDIRLPTRLAETTAHLGLRIARREVTALHAATVRPGATVRPVVPAEALILQAEAVIRVEAVVTRAAAAVTDAANQLSLLTLSPAAPILSGSRRIYT